MKRLITILTGLLALSGIMVAMADGNLFDSGPTPKQSFQQAGQPNAAQPNAENPPARQIPGSVPDVVNRTVTPNNTIPTTPPPMSQPAPATPEFKPQANPDIPNVVVPQQNSEQALKDQLNKVEAQLIEQTQQMQAQLTKLSDAVMGFQPQVLQFSDRLKALEAKVAVQRMPPDNALLQKVYAFDQSLSEEMKLIILILVFMMALLLGFALGKRRKVVVAQKPVVRAAPTTATVDDEHAADTESEYDFMSTTEAIPAKLDLARAYVAMEDYKSARTALQEVIAEGNAQQKQEAQDMLKNLPQQG